MQSNSEPAAVAAPALTGREVDVLRLLAKGFTHKEAARELGLSTRTVDAHRTTARAKFGAKTTPHLIALAIAAGIVPLPQASEPFGRIEAAEDGLLKITGRKPSPEILAQLKGRIGPGEAAVEISAEAVREYLRAANAAHKEPL